MGHRRIFLGLIGAGSIAAVVLLALPTGADAETAVCGKDGQQGTLTLDKGQTASLAFYRERKRKLLELYFTVSGCELPYSADTPIKPNWEYDPPVDVKHHVLENPARGEEVIDAPTVA